VPLKADLAVVATWHALIHMTGRPHRYKPDSFQIKSNWKMD